MVSIDSRLASPDEAAGVDDDDLGVRRVVGHRVAGFGCDAEHDLAVDPVFRAPEADEVNLPRVQAGLT